uniref:Cation/H+ exchanger transmembrane domain-containing protein n=1 Tax=Amphora coffeiformis TaxID=265554 RepID=A0A7S3KWJ9_9STRA
MESDDSKESDSSNSIPEEQHQNQHQPNPQTQQRQTNSQNNMAKRQIAPGQHHHHFRRRYLFMASGFTILVLVFLLRSYESAYLGFEDTQNIKLVYSKENEKKIVVVETPSRSSWLWSSKKPTNLPAVTDVDATKITPRYSVPLHAAEALQCRESVVNFVINATDGKDECVGLQRAFDQTCGVGSATVDSGAATPDRRLNRRRKKRWAQDVLSSAYFFKRWRVWLYRMSRWTYLSIGWLGNVFTTGDFDCENPFFFAEDEIVEAWSQAEYLVEHDLDQYAYVDVIQGWERQRAMASRHLQETENVTTAIDNRTKVTYTLDLPTAQKHASEHLVDQTLSLHQGDKLADAPSNNTEEAAVVDKKDVPKSAKTQQQPVAVYDPVELRRCCASILNVYHENCSTDDEETISDSRLFFVVCVMAACGTVKSLIRHFKVLWLPEAAGCILVGVVSGYIVMFFPHHDLSFDGHWFLRIMVPPIIFEAALSIDKRSFNKHIVPIVFYAVGGTLMATLLTAYMVHQGSHMLRHVCTPLPYVEALTFGALISSIDPIAVLSVLSNMGMTDMDTIYVLIFGESLLNDGVAIVLFETLVRFLDDSIIIDSEEISAAAVHFSVVAIGSLLVGMGAGMLGTVYFWIFHGCQTPLVEVLMFFCWALLPYYICDGIEWSGIVCTVATGFVMDIHIVGQRAEEAEAADVTEHTESADRSPSPDRVMKSFVNRRDRRPIFSSPNGQLSEESRAHIGFVAEIISTTMETAIFAYLGLFLFSHRYHWNVWHTLIAIFSCGASRAVMIPTMSFFANWITKLQQATQLCIPNPSRNGTVNCGRGAANGAGAAAGQRGVVVDKKMQMILWFAGLRGAMSFALVEHVPLYDSSTGEGTPLKPEMKAMTSASILFTVFVLGGYTFYVMEHLGMSPSNSRKIGQSQIELPLLLPTNSTGSNGGAVTSSYDDDDDDRSLTSPRARRRPPATRLRSKSPSRVDLSKNNV